ncbi:MAG: hypothetical protein ACP5RH_06905 [Leptodesmis sp.]|uniref:hypothetical protein n=1 Tax=Leptodesmis sp. TaxID=3100501 RepID=UPI003D1297FA
MTNSILKIFILSIALSYVIKYGGRFLPVSGTMVAALVGVLTLPVLMAIALGWRWQQNKL